MAKLLTIDDMAELLHLMDEDLAHGFIQRLTELADDMAEVISQRLGVEASGAGTAEGGTLVAFYPLRDDDGVPEALEPYDSEGAWEPRNAEGTN